MLGGGGRVVVVVVVVKWCSPAVAGHPAVHLELQPHAGRRSGGAAAPGSSEVSAPSKPQPVSAGTCSKCSPAALCLPRVCFLELRRKRRMRRKTDRTVLMLISVFFLSDFTRQTTTQLRPRFTPSHDVIACGWRCCSQPYLRVSVA